MRADESPVFIGIDPGVSGAVAVLTSETVTLFDVPTRKGTKGELYMAGEMADILRPYAGQAFAILEQASPSFQRPGQGDGSKPSSGNMNAAMKIGVGVGLWEGILAALGIPYEMALPITWKRSFRLSGADKKASRARAQELFPVVRAELAKRRPDFAEALLLAEYGRRRRGG